MKGPRYDVFGPWPVCARRTSRRSFLSALLFLLLIKEIYLPQTAQTWHPTS